MQSAQTDSDSSNYSDLIPPKKENPRAHANVLSKLTFFWTIRFFIRGYGKTLDENDLFLPLHEHESKRLGDQLEQIWLEEVKIRAGKTPSLWKCLIRMFGREIAFYGLALLVQELIFKLSQPFFMGKLLAYYDPDNNSTSKQSAYLYVFGLVCGSFCSVLTIHSYMLGLQHLGMRVRVACCSLMYRKSLKLSKCALAQSTVGEMVNLLANDVNRFDLAVINLHHIWVAPLETIAILYLMFLQMGWTAIVGIAVLFIFVPIQSYMGKIVSVYRLRTALRTDYRIRLTNEVISGIQVIKMYTWEIPFSNLIEKARKLELDQIRGISYIRAINVSFTMFVNKVAIYCSLLACILTGQILTAQYVYVITAYYGILRQAITMFLPNGIALLAESAVSVRRIQQFLLYEELKTDSKTRSMPCNEGSATSAVSRANSPTNISTRSTSITSIQLRDVGSRSIETRDDNENSIADNLVRGVRGRIQIANATASWLQYAGATATLRNVHFMARSGQLVVVVGTVGSGKSSLLHVILRELSIEPDGKIDVCGRLSYASQEPWLFSGTVRQNILFGQPWDAKRYRTVLRVCALQRDLTLWPNGDQTLVGDRGVMLSGGQRARINLARAIYKRADIYLLDDPLSAVDTHVGKQIFDECIHSYLKKKCTILVTHQLQYLKSATKIYLMEAGIILASGTYQELSESGLDFLRLLSEDNDDNVDVSVTSDRTWMARLVESMGPLGRATKMDKEFRETGEISIKVYLQYLKAGGNVCIWILLIMSFLAAQISSSFSDLFLNYWVNLIQDSVKRQPTGVITSSATLDNCLYIYTGLMVGIVAFTLIRSFSFFAFSLHASRNLHNTMIERILGAPMSFFNANPAGRILNRFAKDMGAVDEVLPFCVIDTIQIGIMVVSISIVIGVVSPWVFGLTAVMFGMFYLLKCFYLATSRDVKRMDGTTRSPVFTHLSASLQGLTTIRAFGTEEILKDEFDAHQNLHSSAYYMFLGCTRAFGFCLDIICVIYIAIISFSFLLIGKETHGANVGLSITQAIMLTGMLQWGMRQWSEMENQMTSVERVIEYTKLSVEQDVAPDVSAKRPLPQNWPQFGHIEFRHAGLRYTPNGTLVLRELNISIESCEKVGIVGRTGAGKSSLISALFRLGHNEGQILIDNIDINEIPLKSVRSKISIIPQEPVLFAGELRKNLDPFDEYPDNELWDALEEVDLKQAIMALPSGLHAKMSEGGANFSVGQRQLFCLARAMIRSNRIMVMDEATANVDPQTDQLIQRTIRRKFDQCTVLTIAHRLHTVMDADKILVMDGGRAVEFGIPHELLQRPNGHLASLVANTGTTMTDTLRSIAKEIYESRYGTTDITE